MISKLTIYFPYYNQPDTLILNLNHYMNLPEDIRNVLYIFIVDDGSMEAPAINYITEIHKRKLQITLYRIDIDIPWNQPEANNLAFSKIVTDYVIRTDIDHFFPLESIREILELVPESNVIYKFKRKIYNENRILNPACNIYLISKNNYEKTGGYNEYFSGNYGDDIDFHPKLANNFIIKTLSNPCLVDLNGSTKTLSRNININDKKSKEKNIPKLKFIHKDKYIHLI